MASVRKCAVNESQGYVNGYHAITNKVNTVLTSICLIFLSKQFIYIYILKINSLYKIVHNVFQNVKMLILKILCEFGLPPKLDAQSR